MRRAVQVIMLLLVFAQAGGTALVGAADACAADPCEDGADDEGAGGDDCAPVCPGCTCAARPQVLPAAAAAEPPSLPPIAAPRAGEPDDMPADPGASEILHIPRSHLGTR